MMPQGVPSISPRDAAAAIDPAGAPDPGAPDPAKRPLIVDVREPDEFVAERIAGVALVPISQFVTRHQELPKDRPLLMLCAAGSRSMSATMYLLQAGWTDVRNVSGGMIGWRQAGLPILSGEPQPGEGDLPG
jgi:rhodanese-related sulfurtransferase